MATPEIAALVQRVEHWLIEAMARKETWLEERDAKGRVQRLRHIGKVPHVIDKMQKDMRRWAQVVAERRPRPGCDEPHVEAVLRLDDGFVWVKLKTAEALRWEGRRMLHCVGALRYIEALELDNAQFFSLRDAGGQPHVTLQLCDRKIHDCRGQGNVAPSDFLSAIDALRRAMGWNCPAIERMRRPTRRRHPLYRDACLDREMTIPGNLDLRARRYLPALAAQAQGGGHARPVAKRALHRPARDPGGQGDLRLAGCTSLSIMPRWLWVGGDLDMTDCSSVTRMPPTCGVAGSINLTGCSGLRSVPRTLSVEGSLTLDGCSRLKHIPTDISVGDTINIGRIAYCAIADVNRRLAGGGWVTHRRRG